MRTTSDEIKAIIETDDVSIPDLTPFITVANELVTECCSTDDYTEARLTLIETWLAAHFYAIRDPRRSSEKVGPVGENFQYKVGLNLAVTTYGQQAMLLDTQGGLAALSKRMEEGKQVREIGVDWLGTEDE